MTGTPGRMDAPQAPAADLRVPFGMDRNGRVAEVTVRLLPLEELLKTGHLLIGGTTGMGKSRAPSGGPVPSA